MAYFAIRSRAKVLGKYRKIPPISLYLSCANDGNGSDFMIFFYDANGTDVAYVNDGTAEAFSEYTAETAQTEDGTEYVLVTVGGLQLGYLVADDGSVCIIDNSGNVYAASALTEEEANALYTVVTE